jgi:nucleoside-diphosphate kinase
LTDSNTKEKTSENSSKKQITFGLVKPEAFYRGLVHEIERRIVDSGLSIVTKRVLVLDENQLYALYGHVKNKRPEMYELLKTQMRKPVEVLIVEGDNAVERLLKIRGSSDPKDAAPGSIRGDFAKDYPYDSKVAKLSLNLFHAADSVEDADRMIGALSNSLIKRLRRGRRTQI